MNEFSLELLSIIDHLCKVCSIWWLGTCDMQMHVQNWIYYWKKYVAWTSAQHEMTSDMANHLKLQLECHSLYKYFLNLRNISMVWLMESSYGAWNVWYIRRGWQAKLLIKLIVEFFLLKNTFQMLTYLWGKIQTSLWTDLIFSSTITSEKIIKN